MRKVALVASLYDFQALTMWYACYLFSVPSVRVG